MPQLGIVLSCIKPDLPVVLDRYDEQTTDVRQQTQPSQGDDNGSDSNIGSMKITISANATLAKNAATDKLRDEERKQ